MRDSLVSFLVVILTGSLACNGGPDSASEVKGTLLRALDAIRSENKDVLKQCVFAPDGDEESVAWLPLTLDGAIAQQRLGRLYAKTYGKAPPSTGNWSPGVFVDDTMLQRAREAIDASKADIDKLTARITFDKNTRADAAQTKPATAPANAERPLILVLRKNEGVWKIDMRSLLDPYRDRPAPDNPEAEKAQQLLFRDFLARRIKAWNEVADGIEQRRYRSAEDAELLLAHKG